MSGSPFPDDVTSMAVNGKYLFGANGSGFDIDAYRIQPGGALTYAAATSVFTVTASSYSQSPGSPYTIANPRAVIVQPLP